MGSTADPEVLEALAAALRARVASRTPLIVALDGRSGAGKSTIAAAVADLLPSCVVVDGDDFYAGGSPEDWDQRTAEEKAAKVIDWRRQRPVLEDLANGLPGSWHGYDWEAFDGRFRPEPTICDPADVVILEGAYSARPELADLLDFRVLLSTEEYERIQRLRKREGNEYRDAWFERWDEAEQLYFGTIMPPKAFDLVL